MEPSTFKKRAKMAGEQEIDQDLIENKSDLDDFNKIEQRAKEGTPLAFKDL